jgi:hypothetical protein
VPPRPQVHIVEGSDGLLMVSDVGQVHSEAGGMGFL